MFIDMWSTVRTSPVVKNSLRATSYVMASEPYSGGDGRVCVQWDRWTHDHIRRTLTLQHWGCHVFCDHSEVRTDKTAVGWTILEDLLVLPAVGLFSVASKRS
ncbi:hypothetical protein DXG01_016790 [Tephrocybe rancida]|nr:hypothetical protein DXG01_016790 [Tephrocybe rancida]